VRKPFVIFSLPRSRSAWLAHFLRKEAKVGHDIGIECDTPADFVKALSPGMLDGTCETGAAFAWPLFQRALPDAKYVVVRRPLKDVVASLEHVGLSGLSGEMEKREQELGWISAMPGVTTIAFADLGKPTVLEWLYEYLVEMPLEPWWLEQLSAVNIQLDLQKRISRLQQREPAIAALKETIRKQAAWVH
jgi:hypothetical protein